MILKVNNKSLRAAYVRLITYRDCSQNIADFLWASHSVGHFNDEAFIPIVSAGNLDRTEIENTTKNYDRKKNYLENNNCYI